MTAQRYPVLRTKVDTRSEAYAANQKGNLAMLAKVGKALEQSRAGGGEKYVARHVERGRLLPRQRIELLLDRDSHFVEIGALAGHDIKGETTGAGLVGGIGVISGTECVITASEATVKGGAVTPMGVNKSGRLMEIAEQNRMVGVSLIESAGADLPNQDKIFVRGGEGFRDLTRRSKARIPTVCLVFGSSTAGGAYLPGMSDYVV
ncbi:MAG: acyl-CoA carboxylase subunit beta, partial [Myxococcales bacterium]|nr:acyl-CoA carboxylase subunit beta [Myxococcales bacterium]